MRLVEALDAYEGKKVRVGAYSAYLYFGIVDKKLREDMKKIDPGCMERLVKDIYNSEMNGDVVIIYHSNLHGRFWFESEFNKAVEQKLLFSGKENRVSVKRPKKLNYIHKKMFNDRGMDFSDYRVYAEDGNEIGFVKVSVDASGKLIYNEDDILWLEKDN